MTQELFARYTMTLPATNWKMFVRVQRGDKYAFDRWAINARGHDPLQIYKEQIDKFYKEHPEMLLEMPITVSDPPEKQDE
jgi:hypothetical protein